jgi:hypothetical protein
LVLTMVLLVHPSMLIPVALVLFVVDAYLFGLMLVLKIPFNRWEARRFPSTRL